MTLFHEDIKSIESAPGVFAATVTKNWSVNGNPNGGYLMALMARAMLAGRENMRTPAVTANYIARCVSGPAEIRIEEISSTKQFHRFEARLF
jgi:hypothetical protein